MNDTGTTKHTNKKNMASARSDAEFMGRNQLVAKYSKEIGRATLRQIWQEAQSPSGDGGDAAASEAVPATHTNFRHDA